MNKVFSFPIFAGINIISENNSVFCVVDSKGKVNLSTQKNKSKIIKHPNIIFLRGLEFIIFATINFFLALRKSFVLANKNIIYETKSPFYKNQFYISGLIILVCCFVGFLLLGILSTHLGFVIFSSSYSLFVKNFSVGLVKCLLFYFLLFGLSYIPTLRALWKFNYASNKVIFGKKHRPLNYFNIVISSLLITYFVISLLGLNLEFGWKILVNFGIMVVIFSLVFELALFLENKGGRWVNFVSVVGILTTASPSKTEIEAVSGAYSEVLLMQESNERKVIEDSTDGVNFSFVYSKVVEKIKKANIELADADWLIANVLKCKKLDIKLFHSITKQQEKEIYKALEKRLKGEPIDKIFGFTEFYRLKIKVNKNVLTPRQETEILVETALKTIDNKKLSVLDLCTGSGAIAVALAKNSNANIFASDISQSALDVAKENAKNNNVKINYKHSDLFSAFRFKKFDIIVSNPPYIKTLDIKSLDKEVKNFDPILALDGGEDGYDFYKKIITNAPKHLNKNGKIIFEIGKGQASKIKKLLTESFENIKIIKDYNNIQRIIVAERR